MNYEYDDDHDDVLALVPVNDAVTAFNAARAAGRALTDAETVSVLRVLASTADQIAFNGDVNSAVFAGGLAVLEQAATVMDDKIQQAVASTIAIAGAATDARVHDTAHALYNKIGEDLRRVVDQQNTAMARAVADGSSQALTFVGDAVTEMRNAVERVDASAAAAMRAAEGRVHGRFEAMAASFDSRLLRERIALTAAAEGAAHSAASGALDAATATTAAHAAATTTALARMNEDVSATRAAVRTANEALASQRAAQSADHDTIRSTVESLERVEVRLREIETRPWPSEEQVVARTKAHMASDLAQLRSAINTVTDELRANMSATIGSTDGRVAAITTAISAAEDRIAAMRRSLERHRQDAERRDGEARRLRASVERLQSEMASPRPRRPDSPTRQDVEALRAELAGVRDLARRQSTAADEATALRAELDRLRSEVRRTTPPTEEAQALREEVQRLRDEVRRPQPENEDTRTLRAEMNRLRDEVRRPPPEQDDARRLRAELTALRDDLARLTRARSARQLDDDDNVVAATDADDDESCAASIERTRAVERAIAHQDRSFSATYATDVTREAYLHDWGRKLDRLRANGAQAEDAAVILEDRLGRSWDALKLALQAFDRRDRDSGRLAYIAVQNQRQLHCDALRAILRHTGASGEAIREVAKAYNTAMTKEKSIRAPRPVILRDVLEAANKKNVRGGPGGRRSTGSSGRQRSPSSDHSSDSQAPSAPGTPRRERSHGRRRFGRGGGSSSGGPRW